MAAADFLKKVNVLYGAEFPLIILTISHTDLVDDVTVVNDNEDLVSNGVTYQKMGFKLDLMPQPDGSTPTTTLTIDNVGNILTEWIELSYGGRGTTVSFGAVLRSNPDVLEIPEITVNIVNTKITKDQVVVNLAPVDLLNRRVNPIVYSQVTARGLY